METNITITKEIKNSLGYTIIPFLITRLHSETLFDLLNAYLTIPKKYKSILEHIEYNIKHKFVSLASLTIEDKHSTQLGGARTIKNSSTSGIKLTKTLKKPFIHIHQLFIVVINDTTYNTENEYELLEGLRICGNGIFTICKSNNMQSINIIDTIDNSKEREKDNNTKYMECILEGLLLSSYRFDKYKTDKALNKLSLRYHLQNINAVIPHYKYGMETEKSAEKGKEKGKNMKQRKTFYKTSKILPARITKLINIVKSVFLARDLINEPSNTARIDRFIGTIKQFIKVNNIPVELDIWDEEKLVEMKMGLVLGVGKGSSPENRPKVIKIKYRGTGKECKSKDEPAYVLLGKGITFDTGGLDLKTPRGMIEMKTDLSGASSVISFLLGYALSGGSKCITAICPFAENSISATATKPSDVLTAYNGKTVEITDTDAEGRLVLADCLSYAVEKYPDAVLIDLATLTGQQEKLSDKLFSNILSVNTKKETEEMIMSGREINELLVELPMMDKNLKKLESYVADIKNVSLSSSADIIMSALFMRQFINKDTKWMHIDIAGPSFKLDDVIKYASPEASGIGVRLLFNYFHN